MSKQHYFPYKKNKCVNLYPNHKEDPQKILDCGNETLGTFFQSCYLFSSMTLNGISPFCHGLSSSKSTRLLLSSWKILSSFNLSYTSLKLGHLCNIPSIYFIQLEVTRRINELVSCKNSIPSTESCNQRPISTQVIS